MRTWLFLGAAFLGAAGASAVSTTDAFAKAKGESCSGKFGKTKFKAFPAETIQCTYSTSLGFMNINGNSLKIGLGGGKLAWFNTNGLVADPRTAQLPLTMTNCAGVFSYIKYKGLNVPNQNNAPGWTTSNGMTIVLSAYDAATGRLTGTFTGNMDPGDNNPNATAIAVTKGKFSADLGIIP